MAGITMTTPTQNRPFPDLSTIKAVLFDVDGTLTNSDPLHFKAFQEILVQYNYKVRLRTLHGGHLKLHVCFNSSMPARA